MTARLPRGFRVGHGGDLACPHRDLSVCDACADSDERIVEVFGQHFWMPEDTARAELLAEMRAHAEDLEEAATNPDAYPYSCVTATGMRECPICEGHVSANVYATHFQMVHPEWSVQWGEVLSDSGITEQLARLRDAWSARDREVAR